MVYHGLPINSMVIFHGELLNNQMVNSIYSRPRKPQMDWSCLASTQCSAPSRGHYIPGLFVHAGSQERHNRYNRCNMTADSSLIFAKWHQTANQVLRVGRRILPYLDRLTNWPMFPVDVDEVNRVVSVPFSSSQVNQSWDHHSLGWGPKNAKPNWRAAPSRWNFSPGAVACGWNVGCPMFGMEMAWNVEMLAKMDGVLINRC